MLQWARLDLNGLWGAMNSSRDVRVVVMLGSLLQIPQAFCHPAAKVATKAGPLVALGCGVRFDGKVVGANFLILALQVPALLTS